MPRFSPLLALALLTLTVPACDAGPGAETPRQVVDAGVTPGQASEMLEMADLADALDVADYHIYVPGPDYSLGPCDVYAAAPVPLETVCGVCGCTQDDVVICIDWLCDPQDELSAVPPDAQKLPDDGQACDPSIAPESWAQACNTCSCDEQGVTQCTRASCDEGSWK